MMMSVDRGLAPYSLLSKVAVTQFTCAFEKVGGRQLGW